MWLADVIGENTSPIPTAEVKAAVETFEIELEECENGEVAVDAEDATAVAAETEVTITATADEGFEVEEVTVTAEDTNVYQTYTVTVNREAASTNNYLSDLKVDGATITGFKVTVLLILPKVCHLIADKISSSFTPNCVFAKKAPIGACQVL